MELLAFTCQFASKFMDLSVRFIRIFFLLLVSERSGRRKPPAERSALYNNAIEQFRISVSSIAHVPGNQFYCSPGTRINCPYSGYHELLLPLCPGGRYRRALFSMLSIFRQQSWLLRCTTAPWMFCISASLIGNRIGVGFFLRSDLIW